MKRSNEERGAMPSKKGELENLKRLGPDDNIFPAVTADPLHTVAVTLPSGYKPGVDELVPNPATFVSKWQEDYVRMPCALENKDKWSLITASLSGPIRTCQDIAEAIRKYYRFQGDLAVLEHTVNVMMSSEEREKFFTTTLPGMTKLCLAVPEIVTCPLPLLLAFKSQSISLSQKQVASLLANAFFCTFPDRTPYEGSIPSINFIGLLRESGSRGQPYFASRAQKLRCYLHYFERVIDNMPTGLVTYTRKCLSPAETPKWSESGARLTKLIALHEGLIETEGERLLQVDFADEYIGGIIFSHGCAQEEIIFVGYPELTLSRLFTQKLESTEAFLFTGMERFCTYRGYGRKFQFAGKFVDSVPRDSFGRKCTQILGVDATPYRRGGTEQYKLQKFTREINKAYVGFCEPATESSRVAIASGKWGCGVFHGNPSFKTVIQLLAASQAGRDLVIFTFGDLKLEKGLEQIYETIKDKTVGEVWKLLEQYEKVFSQQSFPDFIATSNPRPNAPIPDRSSN